MRDVFQLEQWDHAREQGTALGIPAGTDRWELAADAAATVVMHP